MKRFRCHTFNLRKNGKETLFAPKRKLARHASVQNVKVGMPAKQVIELIGAPDFIGYDDWSYDMDAEPPFSDNSRVRWSQSNFDQERAGTLEIENGSRRVDRKLILADCVSASGMLVYL